MDITIGIRDVASAVSLDVDLSAEELTTKVSEALNSGSPLVIESKEHETVIVPANALGYVRLDGSPKSRVGFGFM